MRWLVPVSLAFAMIRSANAGKGLSIREVTFKVEHQPDGHKYPNQVSESYTLDAAGTLHYAAYFGGMPTDMNHNDSVDWRAGAAGKRVLETALRLASDKTPGIVDLPDDQQAPEAGAEGVYLVEVTRDDADSSRYVKERRSRAWATLDKSFALLRAAFQKQTGRPKKPNQLPQTATAPPPQAPPQLPPPAAPAPPHEFMQLAVKAANAALDQAYAEFAAKPGMVAPQHPGPWVAPAGALVEGSTGHGFRFRWEQFPPSGFGFQVVLVVTAKKVVEVTHVQASFSPD